MKPTRDRLIVEVVPEDKVSQGGVVLPDTAGEKPQRGKVVSIGPKVEEVEQGDEVLFSKYGGTELKYQGDDFLVLAEADVLAVI